mmetsp:Transcript_626/g.891  ORF Transcript_626/g.891 Transcript_626/m.891 type:complete len:432 (+) Transcript_626:86-1381(+)
MLAKKADLVQQAQLKKYHQQRTTVDETSKDFFSRVNKNKMLFLRRNRARVVFVALLLCISAFVIALDQSQDNVADFPLSNDNGLSKKNRKSKAQYQSISSSSMTMSRAMRPDTPKVEMMKEEAAGDDMEEESDGGMQHQSPGEAVLQSLQDSSKSDNHANKSTLQMVQKMLVHTGHIGLSTPDKDQIHKLKDQIIKLVESDHDGGGSLGYVENQVTSTSNKIQYDSYGKQHKLLSIDLKLRVSSDQFHSVVDKITTEMVRSDITLVSVSTSSRDVTDEFIDASSRASTIDKSREALKALLVQTKSVSEVMEVNRELNRLTQQYESQKERAKYLQKQSLLSTLSVRIEQSIKEDHSEEEPLENKVWWDPTESFNLAFHHVGYLVRFVGDTVVYAIVWSIPCLILGGIFVLFFPKQKNQGHQQPSSSGTSGLY